MMVIHALSQGFSPDSEHSAERLDQIKQTAEQRAMDLPAT